MYRFSIFNGKIMHVYDMARNWEKLEGTGRNWKKSMKNKGGRGKTGRKRKKRRKHEWEQKDGGKRMEGGI